MSDHLYKLIYDMKVETFSDGVHQDHIPKGSGASDALIIASLIFPEDGSFSCAVTGVDGRTGGDIEDVDLFRAWSMMAKTLSESKTLGEGHRKFAGMVFDSICKIINEARDEKERLH